MPSYFRNSAQLGSMQFVRSRRIFSVRRATLRDLRHRSFLAYKLGRARSGGFFRLLPEFCLRDKKIPKMRESTLFFIPIVSLVILLTAPLTGLARTIYDAISAILISPSILLLGAILPPLPRLKAICIFLGGISYPIYAIHMPFCVWLEEEQNVLRYRTCFGYRR